MTTEGAGLFNKLRTEFDQFTYEGFSYALINNELRIRYDFNLGNKYFFHPEHSFLLPEDFNENKLSDSLFRNIVFNMGMVELLSYWKAACPPKLIIEASGLSKAQIEWWKKLYLNGLGEFFYTNGILPEDDFISIIADHEALFSLSQFETDLKKILVPIGGGKDSVVSLELLKDHSKCIPFIINPRKASMDSAINAGFSENEIVCSKRTIDRELLELNTKGFLNGHTPFSAMLAFTSVLLAYLYDISEIALSNEFSANEPTIPGTNINHQYSKSLEFENDFREYLESHVVRGIDYHSFLRPLNELQIASLFSRFSAHFESFRSCNVGSKTDVWCGSCSKCLFTFIILSPFISHDRLVEIFGKDLFTDDSLIPIMEQLSGIADEKPFECIGTIDEVNVALMQTIHSMENKDLTEMLKHYLEKTSYKMDPGAVEILLRQFELNNLPEGEVEILKRALHVG